MNDLLVDLRAKTPFMRLRFDGWYAATAKNGTHRIMPAADFDALLSRLEAAEGLLGEAAEHLSYFSGCEVARSGVRLEGTDALVNRICAHLAPPQAGQKGGSHGQG